MVVFFGWWRRWLLERWRRVWCLVVVWPDVEVWPEVEVWPPCVCGVFSVGPAGADGDGAGAAEGDCEGDGDGAGDGEGAGDGAGAAGGDMVLGDVVWATAGAAPAISAAVETAARNLVLILMDVSGPGM